MPNFNQLKKWFNELNEFEKYFCYTKIIANKHAKKWRLNAYKKLLEKISIEKVFNRFTINLYGADLKVSNNS